VAIAPKGVLLHWASWSDFPHRYAAMREPILVGSLFQTPQRTSTIVANRYFLEKGAQVPKSSPAYLTENQRKESSIYQPRTVERISELVGRLRNNFHAPRKTCDVQQSELFQR
jgi:hypothetical protein